jgi:hypothetical protein
MANYQFAVPYFLKKEGGLSKAKTDSASKNPSPCNYNGNTGYHTNKGVTYSSFIGLSTKLKYTANCNNFLTMPDSIWGKIFKNGYWDFWKSDNIPYQSIADFMTWSVWGSGGGSWTKKTGSIGFLYGFLKSKNIKATSKNNIKEELMILAEQNEQKLWLELINYRYNWYEKLNQPKNLKGWRNGLDGYKKWGLSKYTFEEKKNFLNKKNIKFLTMSLILLGSIYYLHSKKYI